MRMPICSTSINVTCPITFSSNARVTFPQRAVRSFPTRSIQELRWGYSCWKQALNCWIGAANSVRAQFMKLYYQNTFEMGMSSFELCPQQRVCCFLQASFFKYCLQGLISLLTKYWSIFSVASGELIASRSVSTYSTVCSVDVLWMAWWTKIRHFSPTYTVFLYIYRISASSRFISTNCLSFSAFPSSHNSSTSNSVCSPFRKLWLSCSLSTSRQQCRFIMFLQLTIT